MKKALWPIAIIVVVLCSAAMPHKYRCGLDPKLFPKKGQDSRIIEFKRTAIMDTITAWVDGKIIALQTNEPLGFCTIDLSNALGHYTTMCDSTGNFSAKHIRAGTYQVSVSYVAYRKLENDSIHLGPGDIAALTIGMGGIGQDDFKKWGKEDSKNK